jgi:hypothetical protein
MRVLALYLNGKKIATAGVGPDGVLAANVTWVGRSAAGSDRAGVVLGGSRFTLLPMFPVCTRTRPNKPLQPTAEKRGG